MGWLWNSPSDDKDAYASLDPKLKAYVDEQTSQPRSQSTSSSSTTSPPASSQQPQQQQQTFSERLGLSAPPSLSPALSPPPPDQPPSSSSAVPPQSLYQDGRYAHLWSTYTPPSALSASTSSQDQLSSVLSAYTSRRADASRAALENCVEEHIAENECFSSGGLAKKMGACRKESRRFARCFDLQTRLLKALGYMDFNVGEQQREVMRTRADEVWSEICRREDETLLAEKEGREKPVFGALPGARWVKRPAVAVAVEEGDAEGREKRLLALFTEQKREEMEKRLAKLPLPERELEIRLEIAEAEVHRGYGDEVGRYVEMEKEERRQRREEGKSTLGDWLKSVGGWSQ